MLNMPYMLIMMHLFLRMIRSQTQILIKSIGFSRVCGSFHWAPELVAKALGEDQSLALRETAFWSASTLHPTDENDRINT
jgi:hypothetical protein